MAPDITVQELKRMRDEGSDVLVLDVRELDEVETARLDDTLHIPMAAVPGRVTELLPKDRPIVVMCHGGTRSDRVAGFLRENGFENVANLSGGIDAWSRQIDPSVPLY
jgi:rhodanese-related sulfurtransferase